MMHYDLWFPSAIGVNYFKDIDNDQIKKFCLDLKQKSPGRKLSNAGGWQSYDLPLDIPELQPLFQEIHKTFDEYKRDTGMLDEVILKVDNIWININEKGNYNTPHLHPYSAFSGTYYVKCNPQTSGNIVFRNPIANHEYHIHSQQFKHNSNLIGNMTCNYTPEERKIIIFPSWLYHHVEPNKDDDMRISISFNTKIHDAETIFRS